MDLRPLGLTGIIPWANWSNLFKLALKQKGGHWLHVVTSRPECALCVSSETCQEPLLPKAGPSTPSPSSQPQQLAQPSPIWRRTQGSREKPEVVVQSLKSCLTLCNLIDRAHQAPLSFTISRSLLKFMPLSPWCHPIISSSVIPFSSCLQSFPASGSFPIVSSSHQVAKVLEFQLQQWIFSVDYL